MYTQNNQNVHYTPPQLADLFGVNVSTIKRWIDKSYIIASKTPGGHRRVSKQQLIDFLDSYPQYTDGSHILSNLVSDSNELLQEDGLQETAVKFTYYILHSYHKRAEKIILQLFTERIPVIKIIEQVILPASIEIKNQHIQGLISTAQERKAFLTLDFVLSSLIEFNDTRISQDAPLAVIACIRREYSILPLKIKQLLLVNEGWNVHSLGINSANSEVKRNIQTLQPNIVSLHHTHVSAFVLGCFYGIAKTAKHNQTTLLCTGNGWNNHARNKSNNMNHVEFVSTFHEYQTMIQTLQKKS